jgi:hypothetical protein
MSALRVLIDDNALAAEEAVAFWKRFSAWMDEHPGDLAGFARSESLASVHPEMHDGAPVLVASRSAPQQAYANAPQRKAGTSGKTGGKTGGSAALQGGGAKSAPGGGGGARGRKGRR